MSISTAQLTRAQLTQVQLTREKLMQVQTRLDAAIGSFVSIRLSAEPNERDAVLGEAAALLENIHAQWRREKAPAGQLEPDSLAAVLRQVRMLPLLRAIHAQVSQLQRLNDAALGFCHGCLSAAPPPVEDYTPEGVWASVHEPSGPRIRA